MNARRERLEAQIATLKNKLKDMETKRGLVYERITKVPAKRFSFVNEDFIVVTCETFEEMQNVLRGLKPFVNGWKIDHSPVLHLTALYRVDVTNNVYGSELKISFENASGVKYWVKISVDKLPAFLFDTYLLRSTRTPTSSERHYDRFHGVSNETFSRMTIPCVTFKNRCVGWYGGDKTLVCEATIVEMISYIKL